MEPSDYLTPTKQVKIKVSGTSVKVTPEDALVRARTSLEWRVSGLAPGQSIEIDFCAKAGKKGPFPKWRSDEVNPHRGRYATDEARVVKSAAADQIGYWKYDVILRTAGKADVTLDPGVMVKEGG